MYALWPRPPVRRGHLEQRFGRSPSNPVASPAIPEPVEMDIQGVEILDRGGQLLDASCDLARPALLGLDSAQSPRRLMYQGTNVIR